MIGLADLVDYKMDQQVFILDMSFNPEITDELMVVYFDLKKEIFVLLMGAEERKREKYLPTLLIQQIRLQWYKDCRGGNAAAQRNQYPKAMRLPKDFFSYYPLVCLLTLRLSYRGPMDFRSIGTVAG